MTVYIEKNIYLMEKCFHYMPLISFVHVYIDMSFFLNEQTSSVA